MYCKMQKGRTKVLPFLLCLSCMKIIFLDIDGVLNSDSWYRRRFLHPDFECEGRYHHTDDFDPDAVACLNQLTGASIVLSSSWRLDYENTKSDLEYNGVKLPIIGSTPYIPGSIKGYEIQQWLDNNHVDKYVIFDDDMCVLENQKNNFVHTSYNTGLNGDNIKTAKQILEI